MPLCSSQCDWFRQDDIQAAAHQATGSSAADDSHGDTQAVCESYTLGMHLQPSNDGERCRWRKNERDLVVWVKARCRRKARQHGTAGAQARQDGAKHAAAHTALA